MKPTRLFDVIYEQKEKYAQPDAICRKVNNDWVKYSTDEVVKQVNAVSAGLMRLGVIKDDKIALVSTTNRPEWNFLDMGMQQLGAVNVPLYPNISENDYRFILNDCEAKYIFVSDEELYNKIISIKSSLKTLEEVYTFDEVKGAKNWKKLTMEDSTAETTAIETIKAAIKPEDIATIIYTSGTTGTPKGVVLSHSNMISNIMACCKIFDLTSDDKALSFLPMNHVFERMVVYCYMRLGISVYYAESLETIGDNLREIGPNIFTAVPRLLEKVYDKIYAKGLELTGIKKKLFFWALELGQNYEFEGKSLGYRIQLVIANKLIFNKWREALGGNVKAIYSGGSALQPRLARVFTAAGIRVLEGYGLTETSPVIAVNVDRPGGTCFGTVGPVIDNVQVKIADDGEILCKGPNVMIGYYKRDDLTKEVIDDDGWYHTGDIGKFEKEKFLKITDRKKEIFKTSGGKYVAPQPIENKCKESPLIEQIIVIGEYKKFTSAIICPAFPALEDWVKSKGLKVGSPQELIEMPDVINEYKAVIDSFNPNFNNVEQIKMFRLVSHEWTPESGELTPTMKLKRKVIMEKYSAVIKEIYGEE